ncbi:MAG: choice-of-anchor J domain-containing protein [Ignavibacteriaceae bacterium]|jgi:hypothetical protein|nr:choice-of-anchor J domain-containing protein [Ignavibacteriaceae bacterium]
MQNKTIVLLLSFLFLTSFSIAQEKITTEQDNGSRTQMIDKWVPVNYISEGINAIFTDDMNGDNSVAGIQARGWFFDDVDGVGTTQTFQGNETVFSAYEGPTTGYLGENFNGAFGGGLLIDQWLISPAITVSAGDTLKFWHRSPDGSTWIDPLQIWISSTGGTSYTAFDIQIAAFNASITGWAQFVGTIPVGGNIRFAVRYYTTSGGPGGTESNYIGLDYFEVVAGGPPCPVGAPSNPNPANGTTDVSVNLSNISWTNGTGTTQVELQFGKAGSMTTVYTGAPITTWAVQGPLEYAATYNWKVIDKNDTCFTSGATWSFVTEEDPNLVTLFSDEFESGLGLWNIVNNGGTCDWVIYSPTYPNTYTLPATSSGGVLAADVDECGSGSTLLSSATTVSPIDASLYQSVSLEFDNDFRMLNTTDEGYVEVSTDGGSNWTVVWQVLGVNLRNTHEVVNLTSYVSTSAFLLRFRSVQPGWHWWWVVDNVSVYAWDFVPVELTSFTATADNNNVTLNWTTATELNNSGFQVERNNGGDYQVVGFVAGHGTSTNVHNYSFMDQNLEAGTYTYRLKQIDLDGTFEYSNAVEVEVSGLREYTLGQNYPNPFNPSTTINFSLATDSKVSLKIFNVLGQEVAALINGQMSAGSQKVSFDASSLNSGVYFYRLDADGIDGQKFSSTKKMILTK